MLLDYALAFSTDQLITTTADSETILDSEVANPDLGKGAEVGAMVVVKTTLENGTSLKIDVYAGASSADTLICSSRAIPTAELVQGFSIFVPYPKSVARYRKLVYTVDGAMNAGAVDAYETVKQ